MYTPKAWNRYAPHLYSGVLRKPEQKDIGTISPRWTREPLSSSSCLFLKFLRFQSTRSKHNASVISISQEHQVRRPLPPAAPQKDTKRANSNDKWPLKAKSQRQNYELYLELPKKKPKSLCLTPSSAFRGLLCRVHTTTEIPPLCWRAYSSQVVYAWNTTCILLIYNLYTRRIQSVYSWNTNRIQ